MSQAKVMMKDIADSRRVFCSVTSERQKVSDKPDFSALVVSKLFWPKLNDSTLVPPSFATRYGTLIRSMENYLTEYEKVRVSRTLQWAPQYGVVDLTIERTELEPLRLQVTPIQATILVLFENRCK